MRRAALVLLVGQTILLIPLCMLLLMMLRVKNCAPLEGVAFYLLLPAVTVVIVAAIATCAAVFFRRPVIVYTAVALAILAMGLYTGYTTPAVFSYNILYGYFPGLTHDEAIGIPTALLVHRGWTLLIATMVFALAALGESAAPNDSTPRGRRRAALRRLTTPGIRLVAGACVMGVFLVLWFRCELGFASTASFIRDRLGGSARSEHFSLYYDRDAYTEKEIRTLLHLHEFTLGRVIAMIALRTAGPYESYVYGSDEQRRRLIGAGETSIAKPWSGQIHLSRSTAADVLAHELAHLVASRFGVPLLHISLSPALLEGLAMAVEWDWGNRTLHEYAAAMVRFDIGQNPGTVLTFSGFFARRPSASYVLAGSFCKYLIERYGMRAVVSVYGDGDYQGAFGRSRNTLVGEWEAFLDQVPLPAGDSALVDLHFRAPAIFRRVCPRETARLRMEARAAAAREDYGRARLLYAEALAEAGDPASINGLVSVLARLGEFASIRHLVDSLFTADPRPLRHLTLFLPAGDACWALGDTMRAAQLYELVVRSDYLERPTESAALRLCAMRDSRHGSALARYFLAVQDSLSGVVLDSILAVDPLNGCALLLAARERLGRGDTEAAIRLAAGFTMTDPLLEAARLRAEARALFDAGAYQESKARMWASLNYHRTEAGAARAQVWIELCDWMTQHVPAIREPAGPRTP